jgi:hypothetical protein
MAAFVSSESKEGGNLARWADNSGALALQFGVTASSKSRTGKYPQTDAAESQIPQTWIM